MVSPWVSVDARETRARRRRFGDGVGQWLARDLARRRPLIAPGEIRHCRDRRHRRARVPPARPRIAAALLGARIARGRARFPHARARTATDAPLGGVPLARYGTRTVWRRVAAARRWR